MGPHYAVTEEGSQKGADVSTRLAVVNHFQHYLKNASAWCTEELPPNKVSTPKHTKQYCSGRVLYHTSIWPFSVLYNTGSRTVHIISDRLC